MSESDKAYCLANKSVLKVYLTHWSSIYQCVIPIISKEIEQFHVNFIKKTQRMKPPTNNCGRYVETGRYALQIDVRVRVTTH